MEETWSVRSIFFLKILILCKGQCTSLCVDQSKDWMSVSLRPSSFPFTSLLAHLYSPSLPALFSSSNYESGSCSLPVPSSLEAHKDILKFPLFFFLVPFFPRWLMVMVCSVFSHTFKHSIRINISLHFISCRRGPKLSTCLIWKPYQGKCSRSGSINVAHT